jgi:integrase
MPKLSLTQKEIKKIVPPASGRIDYFDTEMKGFLLRVSADYQDQKTGAPMKGAKVFYVQADVLDPATGRRVTRKGKVGLYGEYTPEQARQKAPEVMKALREGKPVTETPPPTLRKLYQHYVHDKRLKANTLGSYKVYFENEKGAKFPTWMDVPLPQLIQMLRPDVVMARFQEVLSQSGQGAASNAFKMLQAIINYGMILYPQHVIRNPVKVISDTELWPKIKARTTRIEPEQLKTFYDGLLSFPIIHRDCYLFALYQGLRPDEAHGLRWQDVNLDERLFDLTWKDSETKHRGVLPLSRQTMEILSRRKAGRQEGEVYVFPSQTRRSKSGHVMLRADKLGPKTGLEITPHSLRRTFIQIGERRLKIARESVMLLTGHVDRSVHGEHYAHLGVEDVRAPLQAIANEIERLMEHGVGGKVIQLATAQGE